MTKVKPKLRRSNIGIQEAYAKGYRVIDGEVCYKNKKVVGWINGHGYREINIRLLDKSRVNITVHRLAAYQKFKEAVFEQGMEVRHLDGNSLNNLESNILIGTSHENHMDKSPEARRNHALRAVSFIRKHSHENIINMHKAGKSYKQIMKETGITSTGTISFIVKQSLVSKI